MLTKKFFKTSLQDAAGLLKRGELIAFPTETVYGLGAPIFQPKTIEKIFAVKGRPQDNPLIAHIAELSDVEKIARDVPPLFYKLAEKYFPGPLTLVVKKAPEVRPIVTAGLDTIAIRMPSHPIALELIKLVGEPLVAPSANLSGKPSSTTAEHVLDDFDGLIAGVIDGGPCEYGMESTVIDLVSFDAPTILRPGSLRDVGLKLKTYTTGPKGSPGMKYRHYAPNASVRVFYEKWAFEAYLKTAENPFILSSEGAFCPLESKTLYARLREADTEGYNEVVIYCSSKDAALLNRLSKIGLINSNL